MIKNYHNNNSISQYMIVAEILRTDWDQTVLTVPHSFYGSEVCWRSPKNSVLILTGTNLLFCSAMRSAKRIKTRTMRIA